MRFFSCIVDWVTLRFRGYAWAWFVRDVTCPVTMKSHRGGLAHACCVSLLHEAAMSVYNSALKIALEFCYNWT